MIELKRAIALKELREGQSTAKPAIVLLASTDCPTCASFKKPYTKLEEKARERCEFYTIVAERVGGRELLSSAVKKYLGSSYRGYPTLFIVTPHHVKEIPYQPVMWSPSLKRFDPDGIARYIEIFMKEKTA